MSELESFHIKEAEDDNLFWKAEYDVYSKIEVDKVIAEKDEEIASLRKSIRKLLKADVEQVMDEVLRKTLIYGDDLVPIEFPMKLVAELRLQKYRRCLAMAEMCGEAYDKWVMEKDKAIGLGKDGIEYFLEAKHNVSLYKRWNDRWFKIAKQFKEAK